MFFRSSWSCFCLHFSEASLMAAVWKTITSSSPPSLQDLWTEIAIWTYFTVSNWEFLYYKNNVSLHLLVKLDLLQSTSLWFVTLAFICASVGFSCSSICWIFFTMGAWVCFRLESCFLASSRSFFTPSSSLRVVSYSYVHKETETTYTINSVSLSTCALCSFLLFTLDHSPPMVSSSRATRLHPDASFFRSNGLHRVYSFHFAAWLSPGSLLFPSQCSTKKQRAMLPLHVFKRRTT